MAGDSATPPAAASGAPTAKSWALCRIFFLYGMVVGGPLAGVFLWFYASGPRSILLPFHTTTWAAGLATVGLAPLIIALVRLALAPWLDRWTPPILSSMGRRRAWLFFSLLLFLPFVALAFVIAPASPLWLGFAFSALTLGGLMALDAMRFEAAPAAEQGKLFAAQAAGLIVGTLAVSAAWPEVASLAPGQSRADLELILGLVVLAAGLAVCAWVNPGAGEAGLSPERTTLGEAYIAPFWAVGARWRGTTPVLALTIFFFVMAEHHARAPNIGDVFKHASRTQWTEIAAAVSFLWAANLASVVVAAMIGARLGPARSLSTATGLLLANAVVCFGIMLLMPSPTVFVVGSYVVAALLAAAATFGVIWLAAILPRPHTAFGLAVLYFLPIPIVGLAVAALRSPFLLPTKATNGPLHVGNDMTPDWFAYGLPLVAALALIPLARIVVRHMRNEAPADG